MVLLAAAAAIALYRQDRDHTVFGAIRQMGLQQYFESMAVLVCQYPVAAECLFSY